MIKRILVLLILCLVSSPCFADTPLKVVTTQAFFADIVRQVGGDAVEVRSVAPPKFNVHFVQPKPSDVRHVSKADLYVHAGLDLESWSDPLLEAAGKPQLFRGADRNLDMSVGIELLKIPGHDPTRAEGDIHLYGNPHYHMDPENTLVMARRVAEKLKEIDPTHQEAYDLNLTAFLGKMEQKIVEWKSLCTQCAGKEILSYHDDIEYLVRFLGLHVHMFLEPKIGIPPTARHLVLVENDAKAHGIRLIVQPTYYETDTAKHVNSRIGSSLVLVAQNAGELPGTENVIDFFDTNIKVISDALR